MLSYRHGFHAGNHADVLKHLVLVALLRHLARKDKPFWIIDTHAGAGIYRLDQGYASKNEEWKDGIGKLWETSAPPSLAVDYLALVRELNPDGKLKRYPGSPWLANRLLRSTDRLKLFELHPTDAELLTETFQKSGRRVSVEKMDGFAGLRALLPPPPRRALVLIDPPYEIKQDYTQVVHSIKDCLARFATGMYAIWYPLLPSLESKKLPEKLQSLKAHWLDVRLQVADPGKGGMQGSGMFVINPPWTLNAALEQCLPMLVRDLGQDSSAQFRISESIQDTKKTVA